MSKSDSGKVSLKDKFKRHSDAKAKRLFLEQLLYDTYDKRWRVYKMNFVRGLFFGFGSVLGGTLLIAILVWVLHLLGGIVPFLGDFIRDIIQAINQ